MINVTKITNKEDSFLLNYWTGNKQETLLVNGSNIISELNKAFASIQKQNEEQQKREEACRQQYANHGSLGGAGQCVPGISTIGDVKEAA